MRWVVFVACIFTFLGAGCTSRQKVSRGIDILRLSDEVQRGVNLQELVRRYGPPNVIDFKANRVSYFAEYEETEHDLIGAMFGAESKEEFSEYWSLVLDTKVPRNALMPVSFAIARYKTDVSGDAAAGPQGRLLRNGQVSWAEWKRYKNAHMRDNPSKPEITGLSKPPKLGPVGK